MDKSLFSPAMIDTFRACRRAYRQAFIEQPEACDLATPAFFCKRFVLQALAEINRGRISTPAQVQKFMGQSWPADKLKADDAVKAFLFAYKSLTRYAASPYLPKGAKKVGAALKVRARIPHKQVYLEDTFDLILWHPAQMKLEFVDFHINPLKRINPEWPTAAILVKQFLAQRLHTRWPFERSQLTFGRVGPDGTKMESMPLKDSIFKIHWPELLKTIEEMETPEAYSEAACLHKPVFPRVAARNDAGRQVSHAAYTASVACSRCRLLGLSATQDEQLLCATA